MRDSFHAGLDPREVALDVLLVIEFAEGFCGYRFPDLCGTFSFPRLKEAKHGFFLADVAMDAMASNETVEKTLMAREFLARTEARNLIENGFCLSGEGVGCEGISVAAKLFGIERWRQRFGGNRAVIAGLGTLGSRGGVFGSTTPGERTREEKADQKRRKGVHCCTPEGRTVRARSRGE